MNANLWFFTGRQYDPEVGLYNYRARHYHPGLGQFMSLDPIGGWGDSANLGNPYAYVGNNPGSWTDPSGMCPWCLVVGGISPVATAGAILVDATIYGFEVASSGSPWDRQEFAGRLEEVLVTGASLALLMVGDGICMAPVASPGSAAARAEAQRGDTRSRSRPCATWVAPRGAWFARRPRAPESCEPDQVPCGHVGNKNPLPEARHSFGRGRAVLARGLNFFCTLDADILPPE